MGKKKRAAKPPPPEGGGKGLLAKAVCRKATAIFLTRSAGRHGNNAVDAQTGWDGPIFNSGPTRPIRKKKAMEERRDEGKNRGAEKQRSRRAKAKAKARQKA